MDPAALDAFVAEHYASVVRSVAPACGDAAAAEDAVQQAIVSLLARRAPAQIDNLPGWVVAVAINVVRRRHRRASVEARAYQRLVPLEVTATGAPDERLVDLRAALAALPFRLRQVVVLHYLHDLHDLDVAAIAASCGGPISV